MRFKVKIRFRRLPRWLVRGARLVRMRKRIKASRPGMPENWADRRQK